MLSFFISNAQFNFYYTFLDCFMYFLCLFIPLLVSIAFFTLAERKVMASIQRRIGPNVVGYWGILQPFADALKLIVKEICIPSTSHKFVFLFSPFFCLLFSLISWFPLILNPFVPITSLNYGILLSLIISSISVYGIFLAGWSSNSKYAILGAFRGIGQFISYEIVVTLIMLPIILFSGSLNYSFVILNQILTIWYIFPLFPLAVCFLICSLAETNRIPFDLVEAEAELVAGYNVEYGGFLFAFFFMSEYGFILVMSSIFVNLFLGGGDFFCPIINGFCSLKFLVFYDFVFSLKVMFISFIFIFLRASLPRYRFDQLLFIGWKILVPFTFSLILFYSSVFIICDSVCILELPRTSIGHRYSLFFSGYY